MTSSSYVWQGRYETLRFTNHACSATSRPAHAVRAKRGRQPAHDAEDFARFVAASWPDGECAPRRPAR